MYCYRLQIKWEIKENNKKINVKGIRDVRLEAGKGWKYFCPVDD
jgi:hypothetical protein